jgi:hypothetical protein
LATQTEMQRHKYGGATRREIRTIKSHKIIQKVLELAYAGTGMNSECMRIKFRMPTGLQPSNLPLPRYHSVIYHYVRWLLADADLTCLHGKVCPVPSAGPLPDYGINRIENAQVSVLVLSGVNILLTWAPA